MALLEKKSRETLRELKSYTFPKLHTGKDWYIDFYAFNPATGTMRRKKIKLNHIEKIVQRRKYADGLINRLFGKLERGWNPWIEAENEKSYKTFSEAVAHYRRYIDKMFADGVYREETYASYISFIRNIEHYNAGLKVPITYIYQFNADFVGDFIEHVYIDRNNSIQTRNNYLSYLNVFSTFLVENRYLKTRPTEGFSKISRRHVPKNRTVIAEADVIRLAAYLNEQNRHYLLACYVLHYCLIRPKEMSMIRIEHISLKNKTLFIPSDSSKNRKEATVTIPLKVMRLMIDLRIFDSAGKCYLFSEGFMPGIEYRNEKQFRDYWQHHVRKDLKFPAKYKFYSLKDTGITSMLRKFDTLTVRDQARHSSILMTDIYTPHDIQQANELIVNHDGVF